MSDSPGRQRGYIRSPRDRGTELDAIVRFEAAGPAPLTRRRTIRVDKTHDPRAVIASVAKPSGVLPPPTLPVWPRRVPQKPGVAETGLHERFCERMEGLSRGTLD